MPTPYKNNCGLVLNQRSLRVCLHLIFLRKILAHKTALFLYINVRAYIEPAINYRLTKQYRTLYENNAIDMVSFLAELKLAGNENTELIILQPKDDK